MKILQYIILTLLAGLVEFLLILLAVRVIDGISEHRSGK